MSEVKKYAQKKVEVNGTEYTLQKLPVLEFMKLRQQWGSREFASGVDDIKMSELVLEHIVVNPKRKIEDFDTLEELEDLVSEGVNYHYYAGK